jgi:AcrR family transcriptional regulator
MPRRRMTRAESQAQTRSELLAAAGRVFTRRGYERASIAEIADEAGYSHGAVYSNFEGKEDLFLALYEQWVAGRIADIEATWSQDATLAERARAVADEFMHWLASDPAPFLLRLEFAVRAAHDRELQQRLATRVGAVPLAIGRLIEAASREQGPALTMPADELALCFQALSLGLALETLNNPGTVRPELNGELAALVVEALEARTRPGTG